VASLASAGGYDRPVAEAPLPTFLIIGAQKSGTRWLRRNLGLHPAVFTPNNECSYFNTDKFDQGLDTYLARFEGWTGQTVVGEATPGYMMWNWRSPSVAEVAERIDAQLPDVRLMAVLRNPVDRLYSAFIHHMLHGRIPHDADLLERVRRRPPKEAGLRLVMGGMYGESLAPYLERFGDRLRVFINEDVRDDPHGVYRAALEHIRADPEFAPRQLTKVVGSYTPPPDSPYAGENGKRRPLTIEERAALFPYFEEDIAGLEELLNRDLSVWRP